MQAADRGFSAAFLDRFPDTLDYHQESARAEDGLAQLISRGKKTGCLRDDVDPTDITLLLLANAGLAAQPQGIAQAASRRLLAHFFRSAQTGNPDPMPPPAPLELHRIHQPGNGR
jgi:hypothetical protein